MRTRRGRFVGGGGRGWQIHLENRSTRVGRSRFHAPYPQPLANMNAPRESVVDRFLRYVRIDTQSAEDQPTTPSTAKQWDLARLLVRELESIGAHDVALDGTCMIYAKLPATIDHPVPALGFLAHMDTSPAVSGADVKPIVHSNYQGGDIVLPGDP